MLTGFRLLIEMSRCVADLGAARVTHAGVDLCELDAIIVKKLDRSHGPHTLDYLEMLRYVERCGVPVFSRPQSLLRLVDRLSCSSTLASAGIPLPRTTVTESIPDALAAIRRYGEAVLKPLYSSKAEGMHIVSSSEGAGLEARLVAFQRAGNGLMYIQERLAIADRDLGVVFLGGEHVGTYARVKSAGSWNTSAREGGHYEPHRAAPEVVALARRAQAAFDLDLGTVDVVETPDGPKVFEVSAYGGFRGSHEALGIDLAQRYARHVLSRVTS